MQIVLFYYFKRTDSVFFFFTATAKANIWHVFLYLLLGVSATASWHKYVKRVAAELPFMAVKINNHT